MIRNEEQAISVIPGRHVWYRVIESNGQALAGLFFDQEEHPFISFNVAEGRKFLGYVAELVQELERLDKQVKAGKN